MKNIREFFARIQNKQLKELQLRTDVAQIIKKHTKIELNLDGIGFSPKTLVIKGLNSTAQSVVFIKKNLILTDIQALLPERQITDVRLTA